MTDRHEAQDEALRVLMHQRGELEHASSSFKHVAHEADTAIAASEALLRSIGREPVKPATSTRVTALKAPTLRSWEEILAEAVAQTSADGGFDTILTEHEIEQVLARHRGLEKEFADLHRLDSWDYAIAGAAGVLAALIDVVLVQVPRHPGFLGGEGHPGGWLSNLVKEKFGEVLPPDTIRALERDFPVTFDPSTSRNLKTPIAGLGPTTHRFQSLGHDPLLAWIFGVRDVLFGEFTAIDKHGQLIIQNVAGVGSEERAIDFFVRLFEALKLVGGHLASDVATPSGLPAPLMPLLSFMQVGSIGNRGYTIGEVARQMYRSGYDFRHFVAGSIPVGLIEFIVRLGYTIRQLHAGSDLRDAIPVGNKPKLQGQLFVAHSVAAAANAGKITVSQSPLSLNWAQWLAFFRYLLPQVHWLLIGREQRRVAYVEEFTQGQWLLMERELTDTWRRCFGGCTAVI